MTCLQCRKHFTEKVKVQWGKFPFQYYWDLGASKVPLAVSGPKRPHLMYLTKQQVAWLQAAGYVLREDKEDESNIRSDSE